MADNIDWSQFTPITDEPPAQPQAAASGEVDWSQFTPIDQVEEKKTPEQTGWEARGEMRSAEPEGIDWMIDRLQTGWTRAKQGIANLHRELGGYEGRDEDFAVRQAEFARYLESKAMSLEDEERMAQLGKSETLGDAFIGAISNPDLIGGVILESIGQYAPVMAATAGASVAGGGLPAAVVSGLGSAASEYTSVMVEAMSEAGQDPTDPAAWLKALSDKKIMQDARKKGSIRGLVIGAFDGMTAGLAGKLLAGAKGGKLDIGARVTGEMGLQAGGGAAGEAIAQQQTGEYNPFEIVVEGLAEVPSAAVEVPGNVAHARAVAETKAARDAKGPTFITLDDGSTLQVEVLGQADNPNMARVRFPDGSETVAGWDRIQTATEPGAPAAAGGLFQDLDIYQPQPGERVRVAGLGEAEVVGPVTRADGTVNPNLMNVRDANGEVRQAGVDLLSPIEPTVGAEPEVPPPAPTDAFSDAVREQNAARQAEIDSIIPSDDVAPAPRVTDSFGPVGQMSEGILVEGDRAVAQDQVLAQEQAAQQQRQTAAVTPEQVTQLSEALAKDLGLSTEEASALITQAVQDREAEQQKAQTAERVVQELGVAPETAERVAGDLVDRSRFKVSKKERDATPQLKARTPADDYFDQSTVEPETKQESVAERNQRRANFDKAFKEAEAAAEAQRAADEADFDFQQQVNRAYAEATGAQLKGPITVEKLAEVLGQRKVERGMRPPVNTAMADALSPILQQLKKSDQDQLVFSLVNDYGVDPVVAKDFVFESAVGTDTEGGVEVDTDTGEAVFTAVPPEGFDIKDNKDGSIEVRGDIDAIRAVLPPKVIGRKLKDGGGLSFSHIQAARVRAALEGREVGYGRSGKFSKKRPMRGGKYIGAPEKFNTPRTISQLVKIMRNLALEGEPGRFWYENSGQAVFEFVGRDIQEARKFLALLSIYSPQAKVDTNTTFAIRAWDMYKAGQPVTGVKTTTQDTKAQEALDNIDEFWASQTGEKTSNFYQNLMHGIDPTLEGKQGATIDLWMMRAAMYDTEAPTASQYKFMEEETNRLAAELGWDPHQTQAAIWVAIKARAENPEVKKATEAESERRGYMHRNEEGERVVTNEKAHYRLWLEKAMAHKPTAEDTQIAKFDFADGLYRHVGQVSWESIPGRGSGVLPGIYDATYAQMIEYHRAIEAEIYKDGVDQIAMRLGLLAGKGVTAPGEWKAEVTPSHQRQVVMAPRAGKDKRGAGLDDTAHERLAAYSSILGLVLKQQGVGYHRPFYKSAQRDANGVEVDFGRMLSPQEMADLRLALMDAVAATNTETRAAIAKEVDKVEPLRQKIEAEQDPAKRAVLEKRMEKLWGTIEKVSKSDLTDGNVALISTDKGVRLVNFANLATQVRFHRVVERALSDARIPDAETKLFASDGDLIENNWEVNTNGQSYVERIVAAGGTDLLGWVRSDLAPRIQRVNEKFSKKYGWGEPGEQALFTAVEAGPDDGRGGRVSVPVYGDPRPGAVRVQGVHFSPSPRQTLESVRYGTGIRGAERARLDRPEADRAVRPRIFFYVDQGQGITPERGVGTNAHTVDLANVYDLAADPNGYNRQAKAAYPNDRDAQLNEAERLVVAAGYDGIYVPNAMPNMGVAVLLGQHTVEPMTGRPAEPTVTPVQATERDTMAERLASSNLPAGRMRASAWLSRINGTEFDTAENRQALEQLGSDLLYRSDLADVFTGAEPTLRQTVAGPQRGDTQGVVRRDRQGTEAGVARLEQRMGVPAGTLTLTKLPPVKRALIRAIERILGRQIVMVDVRTGYLFDGVVNTADPDAIYVTSNHKQPILAVIGHEFIHTLRKKFPEAYGRLALALARANEITDADVQAYRDKADAARKHIPGYKQMSFHVALEEMIADMSGTMWNDPTFWLRLKAAEPTLFGDLVATFLRLIDTVITGLKSNHPRLAGHQYIRDLEATRKILVDFYKDLPKTQGEIESTLDGFGTTAFTVAYHGSAEDFTFFDQEKVGTGEKNQAFGWGLYFAEERGVAEFYRNFVGKKRNTEGVLYEVDLRVEPAEMLDWQASVNGQPPAVRRAVQKILMKAPRFEVFSRDGETLGVYSTRADAMRRKPPGGRVVEATSFPTGGHVYRHVQGIFEEPSRLAGEMMKEMGIDPTLDERAAWPADRLASAYLYNLGIKGVQFLDQKSRAAGARSTSRNFVAFSDADVEIVSKNGERVVTEDGVIDVEAELGVSLDLDNVTFEDSATFAEEDLTFTVATDTPEFKAWFGESKVVDANGEPLRVYTGTSKDQDFKAFKIPKSGTWFTTDPAVASMYAVENDSRQVKTEDFRTFREVNTASRVIPAYLKIENPYTLTEEEKTKLYQATNYRRAQGEVFERAKLKGYDGVDMGDGVYVVIKSPNQIKSAIGNRGTFDPKKGDILFTAVEWDAPDYTGKQGYDVEGAPNVVKVDGREVTYHGFKTAQDAATKYARDAGIEYNPPKKYAKVDVDRAARIAEAYDKMEHAPQDPEVQAAYQALAEEVKGQYQALLDTGLVVEFMPEGRDPYGNPRNVIADVVNNNHMYVYPTVEGFGTQEAFDPTGNPLLAESGYEISGRPALLNDLFRVVHDYFGHIKDGFGFRASGEENAWRSHSAMFTDLARKALTSETRGQNSWLNFGPHGERNRTATTEETVFADQKTGLLPDWAVNEGVADNDILFTGVGHTETAEIQTVRSQGKMRFAAGPDFDAPTVMSRWERFRSAVQNKYRALVLVQDAIGADKILEEQDARLYQINYPGRVRARIEQFEEIYYRQVQEFMRRSKYSLTQVGEYLHARHAQEANAVLKRRRPDMEPWNNALSGMTDAEAQAIIAKYQGDPDMVTIGRVVDAMHREKVKMLEDSGVLSAAEAQAWRSDYAHYVPLHRDMEGLEGSPGQGGSGFQAKGKASKLRAGSILEVDHENLLAHALAGVEAAIIRVEKNEVAKALHRLAAAHQNEEIWRVDDLPTVKVLRPDGTVQEQPNTQAPGVITLKVNGENRYVIMNMANPVAEHLYRGWVNDDTGTGPLGSMLLDPALKLMRFWSAINTSLSPEFVISNFFRDFQTAAYNLSDTELEDAKVRTMKRTFPAMKGIWKALRGDQKGEWAAWYKRMEAAGGTTGWMQSYENIEARSKQLERGITSAKNLGLAWKGFQKVGDFISDYNTVVENAVRLAAFRTAVELGMTERQAAKVAKELTVNFNEKGSAGTLLNSMYLFYNASVQGTVRMFRALGSKRARRLTYATIMVAAVNHMLNALADDDDDEYNRLDPTLRERNFIIRAPWTEKGFVQIPLPWGYNVFHVIGQEVGDALLGAMGEKKDYRIWKSLQRTAKAGLEAFNPLSDGSLLLTLSPTIMDPITKVLTNTDWHGGQLYPDWNEYQPDYTKYFRSAREPSVAMAKWLAENTITSDRTPLVDISPETFDMMWDTFTGSAGRFYADAGLTVKDAVTGEIAEREYKEIPLLRKVYREVGDSDIQRMYYAQYHEFKRSYQMYRDNKDDKQFMREAGSKLRKAWKNFEEMEKEKRQLSKRLKTAIEKGNTRLEESVKKKQLDMMKEWMLDHAEIMYEE